MDYWLIHILPYAGFPCGTQKKTFWTFEPQTSWALPNNVGSTQKFFIASLSSSYPDTSDHSYGASYKWQEQSNGSITLLYANACAVELDYESCEDDLIQRLANGEPVLLYYRNLRVVAKTQENTIVQISYNYTTQTMKQRYQSIQRWTNVPAQWMK